jgi:hypothetical protein
MDWNEITLSSMTHEDMLSLICQKGKVVLNSMIKEKL